MALQQEFVSILKGAALAAGGALLVYLIEWAASAESGPYGPLLAAILAVALNVLRKITAALDDREDDVLPPPDLPRLAQ